MSKQLSMYRWSVKRKQEVLLRLPCGESLDALSRETGLPSAVRSKWRDEFREAGKAGLKRRTDDAKVVALNKSSARQAAGREFDDGQGALGDARRPVRGSADFPDAEIDSVSRANSVSARCVLGKARVRRLVGCVPFYGLTPVRRRPDGRCRVRKPVLSDERRVGKIREILPETKALGFRGEDFRAAEGSHVRSTVPWGHRHSRRAEPGRGATLHGFTPGSRVEPRRSWPWVFLSGTWSTSTQARPGTRVEALEPIAQGSGITYFEGFTLCLNPNPVNSS